MSNINDKKSIINEISVLNSIGKTAELPDQNFTFPSVNNKNEPIPFMLDLLTATIGSEALQRTTGQVMTNFIRKIEPDLKTNLKKQSVAHNSDEAIPAGFVSGYKIPVKKIDQFGKLKTDPASSEGALMYGDNVNNFDKVAYNAITSPGTEIPFGNLKMSYDDVTDEMTFKPVSSSGTMGGFVNSYIDNLTIVNEKEFTTNVMNSIYGTMDSLTKKPVNSIVEEEKIKALINKLVEGDDVASLSDEELALIQDLAKSKFKGVTPVDVGCSIIDGTLFLSDIQALISNNTGNTDPVSVGNAYNTVMENSFGRIDGQINPTNKNAIRDGFFKRLIKTILGTIVFALTSTPQIRVLLMLLNAFKNNGNTSFPNNSTDDVNSQKNFIQCISKSASGLLNEFIFNLLKTELLKIVVPVAALLVKEKLLAFVRIIQNLVT